MRIVVTGSLAYDYIMNFPGYFKDHILPDKVHMLSVSFLVDSMRRMRGGVAGNIAYTLALLGERPLVVATAGPGTLPGKATWYLATNLPRPGGPRDGDSPHPAADLAEIVRIYGIRHWIEQGYKQVKACALHCGSVPSRFLE